MAPLFFSSASLVRVPARPQALQKPTLQSAGKGDLRGGTLVAFEQTREWEEMKKKVTGRRELHWDRKHSGEGLGE